MSSDDMPTVNSIPLAVSPKSLLFIPQDTARPRPSHKEPQQSINRRPRDGRESSKRDLNRVSKIQPKTTPQDPASVILADNFAGRRH